MKFLPTFVRLSLSQRGSVAVPVAAPTRPPARADSARAVAAKPRRSCRWCGRHAHRYDVAYTPSAKWNFSQTFFRLSLSYDLAYLCDLEALTRQSQLSLADSPGGARHPSPRH